jgi:hypothetical protein
MVPSQEIEDNRVRDFHRNTARIRKNKRQAIAHERRKWMVHFYTPNGKPDKLRRPGRKWDPEAYAGPEKMTYCSASGVDLFALNRQGKTKKTKGVKEGSKESVEQRINEVSLQTYLQQVQEYETLLDPLFDVMKSSLGGKPGHPHPAQAGWGPIGEKLPEALEGIAAIPSEWKDERQELNKKELRRQRELERKKRLLEEEEMLKERERQLALQQSDGLTEFNDFFDNDGETALDPRQQQPRAQPSSPIKSKKAPEPFVDTKKIYDLRTALAPSSSTTRLKPPSTRNMTEEEKDRAERRRKRTRVRHAGAATIPWSLLDELDGEKRKFEGEKSYLEFYHKF